MDGIFKRLSAGAEAFLGIVGFVGILVITANAFCRFVLRVPMSWSDEFLRTIMIYGYFIGASVTFCEGSCMRLELLDNALASRKTAHRAMNAVLALINLCFFGIMTYHVSLMIAKYIADGTTQSTSSTPAWILPFGCAVGMAVITLAALRQFCREMIGR